VAAGLFALAAVCLAGDPRLFGPKRPQLRLIAAVLAITVLILAILKTGSRGGLIGFAIGILALGACAGKATRARRLLIAGAVIGALLLLVGYEFSQGTEAAARLDAAWSRGDTAGREAIWKVCWAMFQEKPFFGYGVANNLLTLGTQVNFPFRDTHNFFLGVLTQVGLVGALPLIGAIFHALWLAWRYGGRTGNGLPFALMAALIFLIVPTTAYHLKTFWIIFASAAACGIAPAPTDRAAADL
jgi:O-antigen ligase